MRKNIFQAIYIVLMGLSVYSCSDPVLPKRIGLKGTLNAPIKAGAAKLNSILAKEMNEIFSADKQEGTIVYNVDYDGQTVQTFCIKIPIEMTEAINPNNFLKKIDEQINKDMEGNATPKEINIKKEYPRDYIPISEIKLFNDKNEIIISLNEIAGYVRTIKFGICQENIDSGIGLNFHFDKIPSGLEMTVKCFEIEDGILPGPTDEPLFSAKKFLEKGPNKFGNDKPLPLEVNEYHDNNRMLYFTVTLQPATGQLDIGGLDVGDDIIKGEMSVFHVWTEAKIDLAKALKASSAIDNEFGKYPAEAFDLSRLKKYFDGGFDFNGLEFKIYMDGPYHKSVDYPVSKLLMKAQYTKDEKIVYHETNDKLYYDTLSINPKPIELNDYLGKNGDEIFYKDRDLPNVSGYDGKIDDDTIADVFKTMPADLSFIFKIEVIDKDDKGNDKLLIIYPDAFNDTDDSGAIKTTMMIMLPMSLIATGNNDNKSIVSFPDMFGNGDLFNREKPEDLFSEADIDYIRMTIGFYEQIFTGGYLFINREKDLFPLGVRLDSKEIVLNFTGEQIKEIEKKLITPDIKIELDKGGTMTVPKNMGIVNIKFEMKGLINIGEL